MDGVAIKRDEVRACFFSNGDDHSSLATKWMHGACGRFSFLGADDDGNFHVELAFHRVKQSRKLKWSDGLWARRFRNCERELESARPVASALMGTRKGEDIGRFVQPIDQQIDFEFVSDSDECAGARAGDVARNPRASTGCV
jgi:hypothetical protein